MSDKPEKLAIVSMQTLFGAELTLSDVREAQAWLEQKIEYMLQHDFNGLVNLLYRIDVYENKAKACFGKENKEIAKCLAGLIWERQMQKALRKLNP